MIAHDLSQELADRVAHRLEHRDLSVEPARVVPRFEGALAPTFGPRGAGSAMSPGVPGLRI
jgi:hypothetical protein